MRRLSVLTALLVGTALLTGPAATTAPRGSSSAPAHYKFLKAQVFSAPGQGEIAVGMPNPRTVRAQHRAEGGEWSAPTTLFTKDGVTCGQIDGRGSPGGVALLIECDTPYYEDQAPVHSMAFVTRDLVTWQGKRLPGEAYQDPAISADGSHAAWLWGAQGVLVNRQGVGWTRSTTGFDYDSGEQGIAVDGIGTVSVLGGVGTGQTCVLRVYDRPYGASTEDVYDVAGVEPGCTESGIDVLTETAAASDLDRPYRFTLSRQVGDRWVLEHLPPADAPSLTTYEGSRRRVVRNIFSDATGQALISLGSPDRRHVYAQAYDDAAGTWGPTTLAYTDRGARCRDRGYLGYEPFAQVHAVPLSCGSRRLVLTSSDSATWTATRIDRRPIAVSKTGGLLAAPGPRSTTVVSPAGTQVLDVNAPGRCAFVFPIAVDSLLRLHGGRASRWPTRLQKSEAGGPWKTIQTVRMPATGTCAHVGSQQDMLPSMFFLHGDGQYVSLRVKRGGEGGWHVEHFSY